MYSEQTPLKRKRSGSEDNAMSADGVMLSTSESERRSVSPDIFEDSLDISSASLFDDDPDTEKSYMSVADSLEKNFADSSKDKSKEDVKHESNKDSVSWRGASIEELKGGGGGPWGYPQLPPIRPSNNHAVLFQFPVSKGEKPMPLKQSYVDKWDSEHVRMPFSRQNLCAVKDKDGNRKSSPRLAWEIVEEALLRRIVSSQQLEVAILSYTGNGRWDFSTLHHLLSDVLDEAEEECFFSQLLPSMVQLALQLPALIKGPIPLLKQTQNRSISLSQLQIASLLSNAFFCTFPRRNTMLRNSEYATFPDINFNRLFQAVRKKTSQRAVEKLKCILHYFRRVCHKAPEGVVTFTRRYIAPENLPQWEKSPKHLNKLHITSCGTIEDEGKGMLQVDFANKRIGGGVLRWGCVQEEIRFVICPELIISRLFTDVMDPLEALQIVGCERFSSYKGYGDNFEWAGDYCDRTPRDSSGRLLCAMTAIDALAFRNPNAQYTTSNIARELNKAYVGFCSPDIPEDQRSPVATGNWGCGVYRGNAKLKSLLQLMAATQAGRHMTYFTFGNEQLRDEVFQMYTFLVENQVTVGELWRYLQQYEDHCLRDGKVIVELYTYLYKRISGSEVSVHSPGADQSAKPSSSFKYNKKLNIKPQGQRPSPDSQRAGNSRGKSEKKSQINDRATNSSTLAGGSKGVEVNSVKVASERATSNSKQSADAVTEENVEELMMEVDSIDRAESVSDEFPNCSATKLSNSDAKASLLEQLESYDKMEDTKSTSNPKRKISDYFTAVQKDKNSF